MTGIWLFARQELLLAARARAVHIFTAVFAGLALLVASSGYVLTGGTGFQDFARTAASLVELVLLVVPLAALILGVASLTPDAGAAEVVFSQPVARWRVLVGKLTGLFVALVSAEAIGFGLSGAVLFARTGGDGAGGFAGVLIAGALLTAVFLSLAASIAAGGTSRDRAHSLAVALVLWLVAVVLIDIATLGLASWLSSGTASRVLIAVAILNPVDAIRTATLMAIEGTAAFGDASLALLRFTGGGTQTVIWLAGSVLLWIVLPLGVAAARLSRRDL